MQRKIITTADGSKTIQLPEWDEQYHSKHGAINEAQHVFINSGLHHFINKTSAEGISILEIGFGTGLNAFLSLIESDKLNVIINYIAIDAYPVSSEEIKLLNYSNCLGFEMYDNLYESLHKVDWEHQQKITNRFMITKRQEFFEDFDDIGLYDLIYFDAFGPRVQPDLWTEKMFSTMYAGLKNDGVIVTYSAKGSVRRALQTVGFIVERLQGPPGKREMLRATKHR